MFLARVMLIAFLAGSALRAAGPRARDLGIPFDGAPGPQNAVSYAMQRRTGPAPAFVYSVGDWVYFGGDEGGWDSQVYEAYAHLDVPLVGIPGNHDDQYGGDPPYDPSRGPLDGWMANMCTAAPQVPPADPQFEY